MLRHALTAIVPVAGIVWVLAEWARFWLEHMR
jgi:hypothetical protein